LVSGGGFGAPHPPPRPLEHLARDVDAGDAHLARIKRQRDAGADAHLEHAVAGLELQRIEHRLASRLEHGAEDHVVHSRVAPVGRFDGFDLHFG
jgi:hypothetical protein